MLRQGGPTSAPNPAPPSGPTETAVPVRQMGSEPKEPIVTVEKGHPPTTNPSKRKKAQIGTEKEILVPDWNIDIGESLFGTTGARADAADLFQGIFLPEDRRKLDAISSVESAKALSILMANGTQVDCA